MSIQVDLPNFQVVTKLGVENIINCVIQAKLLKLHDNDIICDTTLRPNDVANISIAVSNFLSHYLATGTVEMKSMEYFPEEYSPTPEEYSPEYSPIKLTKKEGE